MPNAYVIEATDGAVRLRRTWRPDPSVARQLQSPPRGGGGAHAGEPRAADFEKGESVRFSPRSRRRMRWEFSALPWELMGRFPAMVTFTYPADWRAVCPDARTFFQHREALKHRWTRRWGQPVGVWVAEFQPRERRPVEQRGAPHLHLYVGLPEAVDGAEWARLVRRTMVRRSLERRLGSYQARAQTPAITGEFCEWLRKSWYEVVGSGNRLHAGRGVDIAVQFFTDDVTEDVNRSRIADYFWMESGKWAQKEAPEGFGSLKFYGRWGGAMGFAPQVASDELTEREFNELRRVMVRWWRLKQAEADADIAARRGVPLRSPVRVRARGRDGVTVYRTNPDDVARLVRWARDVAAWKQHLRGRLT